MNFTLKDNGASLSPHVRTSPWNILGGQYSPLLWPMRETILDVATTPPGQVPASGDWVRVFHGHLGDRIKRNGAAVTCECRDLAKLLQDCWIEEVRQYGSEAGVPVATVLQAIMNDNMGADAPVLWVPQATSFMVKPYQVEYQSVWSALQAVAAQMGWFLGYRWDPGTGEFRLALVEPPRDKTAPDWAFTADDDIYTQDLDVSDTDVRNVVQIIYRNRTLNERRTVTVEDATSIAEFGRRAMGIEEGDTSLIDTESEARTMAALALGDLKDMTGSTSIDMPLFPAMDVFSTFTLENRQASDTVDFFAVDSVRHTLDFEGNKFRTAVIASRKVRGSRARWLRMQTRPGSAGDPGGGVTNQTPDPPTNVQAAFGGFHAAVSWDTVPAAGWHYRTRIEVWSGGVLRRTDYATDARYDYTYEYNSEDHGGQPVAQLVFRVAHENVLGTPSESVEVTAANTAPVSPVGFVMTPAPGTFTMSIDQPKVLDLSYVEFQLGLKADYSDALTVHRGPATHGVLVPITAVGTNYGRVRLVDIFGQAGPWATSSAVGQDVNHEPDTTPPAVPTGVAATGYADTQTDGSLMVGVNLVWDGVADADLASFVIQRREGTGGWSQLGTLAGTPGASGLYSDTAGLKAGVTYEYQVAANDATGNRSAWSASASVIVPGDTTPPGPPTGVGGAFVGNDAVFVWDPCPALDYSHSRAEFITGGVVRRAVHVGGNSYAYTLSMNEDDHASPVATVKVRVAHIDWSGNVSDTAEATVTRPGLGAPGQPTVKPMFGALWVELAPLGGAAGYFVHITPSDGAGNPLDGAVTAKIRVGRVTTYAYQASPGSYFLVAVSAFDVFGETPVCAPVEGGTLKLNASALEPGVIKSEHIEAGSITEAQVNWKTHLIF